MCVASPGAMAIQMTLLTSRRGNERPEVAASTGSRVGLPKPEIDEESELDLEVSVCSTSSLPVLNVMHTDCGACHPKEKGVQNTQVHSANVQLGLEHCKYKCKQTITVVDVVIK